MLDLWARREAVLMVRAEGVRQERGKVLRKKGSRRTRDGVEIVEDQCQFQQAAQWSTARVFLDPTETLHQTRRRPRRLRPQEVNLTAMKA